MSNEKFLDGQFWQGPEVANGDLDARLLKCIAYLSFKGPPVNPCVSKCNVMALAMSFRNLMCFGEQFSPLIALAWKGCMISAKPGAVAKMW